MPQKFELPFDVNEMTMGLIIGGAVLIGLLILIGFIKTLLYICPPNQVMIFSGFRHKMADGTSRGFRTVFGGRAWKKPFFEKVSRMSLNVMEVPISIRGAYSKGGIPLNVESIANVKISSDPNVVGNAIERFLGRDPNEIKRVAKETLEGQLRGVLAQLTPEEVNEDRLKFAEELTRESEHDLNKLGIHLDTFKIQHVSDDVLYLDSIGREAIANVVKAAEIAESDAKRDAELAEAANEMRGNVARANAEANIFKMRNELRKVQAELEANVKAEEERTAAAARQARAEAEKELQDIRSVLEGIRLQADTVLPANAQQTAQEFRAKGQAAIIRERGNATSQALQIMNEAWSKAGAAALTILLIEDLEKILAAASKGVSKVKVGHLSMIDKGDGSTLTNYVAAYPAMLGSIFDAVTQTTGIDIRSAISAAKQQEASKA